MLVGCSHLAMCSHDLFSPLLLQICYKSDCAALRKPMWFLTERILLSAGVGIETNISLVSFCRIGWQQRWATLLPGPLHWQLGWQNTSGSRCRSPLSPAQQPLACWPLFKGQWPFPGRSGKTSTSFQEPSLSCLPRRHEQSHWPWGWSGDLANPHPTRTAQWGSQKVHGSGDTFSFLSPCRKRNYKLYSVSS